MGKEIGGRPILECAILVSSSALGGLFRQRSHGQAVISGAVPSRPRCVLSFFLWCFVSCVGSLCVGLFVCLFV